MILMRERIISGVLKNLKVDFAKRLSEADNFEIYQSLSKTILEYFAENWTRSNEMYRKEKNVYYFSAEFLMGRSLGSNLVNLSLFDEVEEFFKDIGVDYNLIEEVEEDGGLGNGGLGRLAACFLDSLATLNLAGHGYGIRYRNGIFKQSIENGFQVESPINWIKYQAAWSVPRYSDAVYVEFGDMKVKALPYDTPIIGYGTGNINTLRLWEAHPMEDLDIQAFNDQRYDEAVRVRNRVKDISRILYPNDSTAEGKKLRLRQQYFFVSASLQDIIARFKENISSNDFSKFPDYVAIQLNDTHPVVAIPELMRLLMDNEKLGWDEAFSICNKIFAYTNHTIMAEALERWWINFYRDLVPRVYEIIVEMDKKWRVELKRLFPDDIDRQGRMAIIQNELINMAWMAIYASHTVNGVAEIHTEILKYKALKDWYEIFPEKFQNKTNGITQRRWVAVSNKPLTQFINSLIGSKWIIHCEELKKLENFQNDIDVLNRFLSIKREKKEELADYILQTKGIEIDPASIYDVQVKRIHEYKRQTLNVLYILDLYFRIREGRCNEFYPMTFIFAGKAAPGYFRAKGIIKLINAVADLVNEDPIVSKKVKVVFIEDFKVSVGEKIYPATDISVQISTAGKEASGTGNMKFMMNGALTLGTYDGANVEIVKEAGEKNAYIFGARLEEIEALKRDGYNHFQYYENVSGLKRALNALIDGTISDNGTGMFKEIYDSILYGSSWEAPDQYFVLKDFEELRNTRDRMNRDYLNNLNWAKKAWINIANSGKFSSDRTILEYAKDIWKIEPKRV